MLRLAPDEPKAQLCIYSDGDLRYVLYGPCKGVNKTNREVTGSPVRDPRMTHKRRPLTAIAPRVSGNKGWVRPRHRS